MVKLILVCTLQLQLLISGLPAAEQQVHNQRPAVRCKIDLWRGTTHLRGANIWQKVEGGRVIPQFTRPDFHDLKGWGANYVNISHPGIYSVHRVKNRATGRKEYVLDDALLTNLKNLIEWANDEGLFAVVAFRTGPE